MNRFAAWRQRRAEADFRFALETLVDEVVQPCVREPAFTDALTLAHQVDDDFLVEILISTLAMHDVSSQHAREIGRRLSCVNCPVITDDHITAFLEGDALGRATRAQYAVFGYLFTSPSHWVEPPVDFTTYLGRRAAVHLELDPGARELASALAQEWVGTLPDLLETTRDLYECVLPTTQGAPSVL